MIATVFRKLVNDHWLAVLIAWLLLAVGLKFVAPPWEAIALDGDLDYLPASAPSLQAERLLNKAFPDAQSKSQAVLVFAREDGPLTVEDRQYALDLALAVEEEGPPDPATVEGQVASVQRDEGTEEDDLPIVDVWHAKTDIVSSMLQSSDKQAELVVARMNTGLMAFKNIGIRDKLDEMIELSAEEKPDGLQVGLTGSTIIGGDMRSAVLESLEATHRTTIILVLACLLVIYRAPLLVLVPLATIGVSMSVAYDVVALLAEYFGPGDFWWSNMKVFTTTKIFVVVILFGAGTDYCLFLIARYKEELQRGEPSPSAPGVALNHVGEALAGSALTTIVGLATMVFAHYGKFSSSGPIIAVCLLVALAACVTFAPALLRAVGPRVFWPFGPRSEEPGDEEGSPVWRKVADVVMRRPATILFASALLAAPLVWAGLDVEVTHDLLGELPEGSESVEGAKIVQRHFGDGWLAPVTVIAKKPGADFSETRARFDIARLHQVLYEHPATTDVRSLYLPTGGDPRNQPLFNVQRLYERASAGSPITIDAFVSMADGYAGEVTQLSAVLAADPFSKKARELIPGLREALDEFAATENFVDPDEDAEPTPNPWFGAEFALAGTTPGMRDLERITNADRLRIQIGATTAVFLILVALLRRPVACVYLLLTVLLSYWATLGITEWFFGWVYGDSFHGLDWKAPIFLFVILIAIGQDYNIYLTTRIIEEQRRLGLAAGLRRAMLQTGGIITSCGVIMAGTFVSMTTGTLRGMVQLGFALALGVLIDTFFVRSVVVPCYFALVARWQDKRAGASPTRAR